MSPISDEDIQRIVDAVARSAETAFHIEAEQHYNAHRRCDKMLDAFDGATNIFWKTSLGLFIVGAIVLSGLAVTRGVK